MAETTPRFIFGPFTSDFRSRPELLKVRKLETMNRRSAYSLKLCLSVVSFLGATIVTANSIRNWTGAAALVDGLNGRGPASVEQTSIFEGRGNLSASELGVLGSTILIRGRRVIFHESLFTKALNQSPVVLLNLFADLAVAVRFQNASAYWVNEELFVGQVEGDDESEVRIMVRDHVMDGTIRTRGREYRIIDGANGVHFVTEATKR